MSTASLHQLQLAQQNLENVALKKQQIQSQLTELESAATSLSTSQKSYKIIGNVMVSVPSSDLQKEVDEKKEMAQVRLQNFIKQEESLKKSIEDLQKKMMEELQKK